MRPTGEFKLPFHLRSAFRQAVKLEWITLAYLFSVIIVMILVTGNSQAMKTAWLEDVLSTLPAVAFLVASRYFEKPGNKRFPYGFHRVYSIAFLAGSLALFAMGCFLAIDSSIALIKMERPTIGSVFIFGKQIWMGWIMILVLCYSAFPSIWLGYKKMPLAKKIHNKILFTDAETQKADYQTAFAAIIGIIGVGLGFWWMDALAALAISVSVILDGVRNLKNAVSDLMDRSPMDVSSSKPDELVQEIIETVAEFPWVEQVRVRFREEGMVYFGEVYVIAKPVLHLDELIMEAQDHLKNFHWKIHDISIMPVRDFDQMSED